MIAGFRSYLAASGVDVEQVTENRELLLSADQNHLVNGRFDVDSMMRTLETALKNALESGYTGLWASGDMTLELGPEKDFSKLIEYECRLEEFMDRHPQISGICQYHVNTLPPEALRVGVRAHGSVFVNETLSLMNPHYVGFVQPENGLIPTTVLDTFIDRLLELQKSA